MSQSDAQKQSFEVFPQALDGLTVCGISGDITGTAEEAAVKINALWQDFSQNVASLLTQPKPFYAVYSNYDEKEHRPAILTIGFSKDDIADKSLLNAITVPAANYVIFSAQGPQPKALAKTWDYVAGSDLKRLYAADYEIYGPRYFQDGLHEILVCIGVEA